MLLTNKLVETANSEYLSRKNSVNEENIVEILVTKCLHNMHKSVFELLSVYMFDENFQENIHTNIFN